MAALIRRCQPALQQLKSQLRASSITATRSFATAEAAEPAADDTGYGPSEDPVMDAFKLQQSAYRQIIEGLQKIDIPLGGDAAAIRKYADEVEALKKKAGYPDFKEIAAAQLDQTMAESSSYSQFLTAATQGKDFGDDQEAVNALIAAAEAAEEETGVLTEDNEEGLSMYSKAVAARRDILSKHMELKAKYAVQDNDKLYQEGIYAMYESHVNELRETVIEATETAKKRDHLEHVNVDLSAIKPKWDRA